MRTIAAIVVTHNRIDYLLKNIESLLSQTARDQIDILIIDNDSSDGTFERLDSLITSGEIKYFNTGSNLGGAGGFSYGINIAVNLGYEYLWIMDDDTFPQADSLQHLIDATLVLNNDFGFLSSYVIWKDGSPCVMNLPHISPAWQESDIATQFDNQMILLERSSFVSMLIKSSVVKEIGLPIKEFFIWGDDTEYSRRISKNYRSYFVYRSKVVHAINKNIGTSIVDEEDISRIERYTYLFRNEFYMARNSSFRHRMAYYMLVIHTIISIVRNSPNRKRKRCIVVMKGYLQGLFFYPHIEKVHPL